MSAATVAGELAWSLVIEWVGMPGWGSEVKLRLTSTTSILLFAVAFSLLARSKGMVSVKALDL